MKKVFFNLLVLVAFFAATPLVSCGSENNGGETGGSTKVIDDFTPLAGNDLYGKVVDVNDKPLSGVVVSDGYQCVTTDTKGYYQLKRNGLAHFVFYSIPEGYAQNSAEFYQKLVAGIGRYDFKLQPSAADDSHFYLLTIADPQVRSDDSYRRFRNESMDDITNFVKNSSLSILGLSMGDDVHEDCSNYEKPMHNLLNSTAMPLFSTVGNHDYFQIDGNAVTPRSCKAFEDAFGPSWYSFNKGNVHFISLNDVKYTSGTSYQGAFSDEELAWMKSDLSYVDKSKLVVVYYHIPIRDDKDFEGRDRMLNLLVNYSNKILMCGHTHYMRNYVTKAPIQVEERIQAAACGAFWHSTVNGDGTPNGFGIYEIKGNQIVDNWYQSAKHPKDYQIRLFHGDAVFGGPSGSYSYGLGADYVVANVWNWDYRWKVYCYEDNVLSGEMTNSLSHFSEDAWACGYHIGMLKLAVSDFSPYTMHDFIYQLKNPRAKVKIVATDGWGHTYSQDVFTTDFSEAEGYSE